MRRSEATPAGTLLRLGVVALLACAVVVGLRLLTLPPVDRVSPTQSLLAPVDINSATEAELSALPRIGPALARRIVEDRAVSGAYSSIDDLDRVPGIGPRTVEAIRPHAVARQPG